MTCSISLNKFVPTKKKEVANDGNALHETFSMEEMERFLSRGLVNFLKYRTIECEIATLPKLPPR